MLYRNSTLHLTEFRGCVDGLKRLIGKVSGVATGARRYDAASGTKRAGAIGTGVPELSNRRQPEAAGTIRSRARYLAENAPLVTGAVDNLDWRTWWDPAHGRSLTQAKQSGEHSPATGASGPDFVTSPRK